MSDITVITDSQQSELVTNGLAKNGELYLKADGSTDAGSIVVYDSGSWRTFANEASSPAWNGNTYSVEFDGTNDYVDTGDKFDFMQQTMNFTVSAWIKLQNYTQSSNQYILHTTDSGSRIGFMLWFLLPLSLVLHVYDFLFGIAAMHRALDNFQIIQTIS